ncbi:hypothetical protein AGR6A_Cc100009 [Agrobacterium sp. NCPPB 925]|nr:hypothetical protein AGR6A_Cc100009 [Agrobacterium sp. NCPPB 925]
MRWAGLSSGKRLSKRRRRGDLERYERLDPWSSPCVGTASPFSTLEKGRAFFPNPRLKRPFTGRVLSVFSSPQRSQCVVPTLSTGAFYRLHHKIDLVRSSSRWQNVLLIACRGMPGAPKSRSSGRDVASVFFPETVGRGMRMSFIGTDGAWQGQGRWKTANLQITSVMAGASERTHGAIKSVYSLDSSGFFGTINVKVPAGTLEVRAALGLVNQSGVFVTGRHLGVLALRASILEDSQASTSVLTKAIRRPSRSMAAGNRPPARALFTPVRLNEVNWHTCLRLRSCMGVVIRAILVS